jgi:hypothetical protein
MTQQEAFDKVVINLRRQDKPSIDDKGHCLFRGPNGTKCAVGWLIPDEEYKPEFDVDGMNKWPPYFNGLTREFLIDIQKAHDTAAALQYYKNLSFTGVLEDQFRYIAAVYTLTIPPRETPNEVHTHS